jgi:hypothetical protein
MIEVILDEKDEGDGMMYERMGDELIANDSGSWQWSPWVTTAMSDSDERFL